MLRGIAYEDCMGTDKGMQGVRIVLVETEANSARTVPCIVRHLIEQIGIEGSCPVQASQDRHPVGLQRLKMLLFIFLSPVCALHPLICMLCKSKKNAGEQRMHSFPLVTDTTAPNNPSLTHRHVHHLYENLIVPLSPSQSRRGRPPPFPYSAHPAPSSTSPLAALSP
jgi:hypothetical protein